MTPRARFSKECMPLSKFSASDAISNTLDRQGEGSLEGGPISISRDSRFVPMVANVMLEARRNMGDSVGEMRR